MSNKPLVSNLIAGFLNAKRQKQHDEELDHEKKARLKLFELQITREQQAQADAEERSGARRSFFDEARKRALPSSGFVSSPGQTGVQIGDVRATMAAPASLAELLADAQMEIRALEAGIPLPQPREAPNEVRVLEQLLGRPELAELKERFEKAGSTRIDLAGDRGLSPPPPGFARPDPTRPGLVPEAGGPAAIEAAVQEKLVADAFNLYEEARSGLMAGLEGTTTGPVLGKLPAITSKQQVGKGTVAAMAPVLKQLFRVAGEGVFTDRDQQLLIDMIPTRVTSPAARKVLMDNIDNIVRAKLGMGPADPSGGSDLRGQELPQGIPPGSVVVGTDADSGRPVYRAPDGRMLIVD